MTMKYRHPAEAPVAWHITDVSGYSAFTVDQEIAEHRREMGIFTVTPLYLRPDPGVSALLIRLNEAEAAAEVNSMRASAAQDECDSLRAEVERLRHDNEVQMGALVAQGRTIGRVRALADRWIGGNETCPNEEGCTWCKAREEHADELRAELEGSNEGQ
jgi:hypothetical protein